MRFDVKSFYRRMGNPARSIGARKAHSRGDALESLIKIEAQRQSAVLSLEALPKCGAQFTGPKTAHPQPICCDFIGCFTDGRALFFDCKRTESRGSLALGNEKIVKRHQRIFLYGMRKAGAVAGLLVEHDKVFRWLDGAHLGDWIMGGRITEVKDVAWNDPRWMVLGSTIDFHKLREFYGR